MVHEQLAYKVVLLLLHSQIKPDNELHTLLQSIPVYCAFPRVSAHLSINDSLRIGRAPPSAACAKSAT